MKKLLVKVKNKIKAPKTKTLFIISIIMAVITVFSVLLFKITVKYPKFIDTYYFNKVFKVINFPGKLIISLFPFSVSELLLVAIIFFIIFYMVRTIINTVKYIRNKQKHPYIPFLRFVLSLIIITSSVITMFVFNGGLNYNSSTFADRAGFVLGESSTKELEELCMYLGQEAGKTRKLISENEKGVIDPDISLHKTFKKAKDGYFVIKETYPYLGGFYPTAKPVLSSVFMCYTNITGIYPYIIPEALINYKTPAPSLPATICHEMAHQRGISREDEANYIAFIACINNPDPVFKYSGYYMALGYAMNSLYQYDGDAANRVSETLDPGIYRDMAFENEFWKQFETPKDIVATISETVNNNYLETVHVEDGTHSYGRMVDLLIAARREQLSKG